MSDTNEKTRQTVREGYADIAEGKSTKGCCGASAPKKLAGAIGYTNEELEILPDGANMGLSCGNPTAIAGLKEGQVVLDLGSGGGLDVFIAAKKVGAKGLSIGVDMTPEMLSKARAAISKFTEKTGLSNVEFRLGEIEHLPVADSSIDVIISNCVINLSPDKQQVWREITRVLKPGAKACVSDLALLQEIPEDIRKSASAYIGCVGGAILLDETKKMINAAGLTNVQISIKKDNMDNMVSCNKALYQSIRNLLPAGKKLSDYVVSADFTAFKKD